MRLQAVEELQEEIAAQINAATLGSRTQILVEGRKRGKWFGLALAADLVQRPSWWLPSRVSPLRGPTRILNFQ